MARKEEKPTKEVSPPDIVLFLLLAGILFGLMVWRHIHLPDEERPKTSVHGRMEAPLPPSLALLWPSGQLNRSAPSAIKKAPNCSHPEISHGPFSSLP